jgi:hypothetical protein
MKTLKIYEPGITCYIGDKDSEGLRHVKAEIDHIRIFANDIIMYSVRFWKDLEVKYHLAVEDEIDFRGIEKKEIGFKQK